MKIVYILAALGAATLAAVALLYLASRWLARREPYGSFLRLKTGQKVAFFKAVLADRRTSLWVKALPVLLVLYLANPIDLIPDFIPVLGYLDDVAVVLLVLALTMRFTPRSVVDDAMRRASGLPR